MAFFDLKKSFDMINRSFLFYKLLTEYGVGRQFLKILMNIYEENDIFVKLSQGLTQPIRTVKGVKQGCVLSPLCFNLFINNLPTIFINTPGSVLFCDPAFVGMCPTNCLMFADDCAIFSLSETGLQNSINLTSNFFESLGLPVNTKKTKVLIFNKRGLGPSNFPKLSFTINGVPLEICDKYTYLGVLFKPSGSFIAAQAELYTKASKAWFSISNIIYQHKKMPVSQSLQLLDSLVMPVGLYSAELLTLLAMPDSAFTDRAALLAAWENFPLEKINQRACRMLLSVQRRSSRLACLGELGRFLMIIKALVLSIKYNWNIKYKCDKKSLVYLAYNEMQSDATDPSWLTRVEAVQSMFGVELHGGMSPDRVTRAVQNTIQSKFELYWKDEVCKVKLGLDNLSQNKLRFYSQLKSCFKHEPYIDVVTNRNQRSWLSRLRISSHNLAIERGRYSNVPVADRVCVYCVPGQQHQLHGAAGQQHGDTAGVQEQDSEVHFLARCSRFTLKRACFVKRLECFVPSLSKMTELDFVKTILCPVRPQTAKICDKYIGLMFKARDEIDSGAVSMNYPTFLTLSKNMTLRMTKKPITLLIVVMMIRYMFEISAN